jgi:hypothetical protein
MEPMREGRAGQGVHDAVGGASAGAAGPGGGGGRRRPSRGGDALLVALGVCMFLMGSCAGSCSRGWSSAFPRGMVTP